VLLSVRQRDSKVQRPRSPSSAFSSSRVSL
jgi:hypothetical protein